MIVRIGSRFQRSVHIAKDRPSNAEGYILTETACALQGRINAALSSLHGPRAWTLIGPYGSGKSAFALFLVNGLASRAGAALLPILVEGGRESLSRLVVQGLVLSLRSPDWATVSGAATLATRLQGRLAGSTPVSDAEVREALREAACCAKTFGASGVVLVIDELGKALEYAAQHPDTSDVYLLQILAEDAARSSNQDGAEVVLFTILHQAVERYADRLSSGQRDEWRKVQGRFEIVTFAEPTAESLRLIGAAIERTAEPLPESWQKLAHDVASLAKLSVPSDVLAQRLEQVFPLHPAAALLVGPIFQRLGQNERSLFAFLGAGEPGSLLPFLERHYRRAGAVDEKAPLYTLSHLYEYLAATQGGALSDAPLRRRFAEAEAALMRMPEAKPSDVLVLRQVAVLNAVGASAGLFASKELLALTSGWSVKAVELALERLIKSRALVHHRISNAYHVWEGSDFDLEGALLEARQAVPQAATLAEALERLMPPSAVVARRHSYDTGTLRSFEVVYSSEASWKRDFETSLNVSEARLLYLFPNSDERADAIERELADLTMTLPHVAAIVAASDELTRLAYDAACWAWVESAKEDVLAGDAVARREVSAQRGVTFTELEARLRRALAATLEVRWIAGGRRREVRTERELQALLSEVMDTLFPSSPRLKNELVNRRRPSSSAARATKELLIAMRDRGDKARLGFEGTPAPFGLYESVLRGPGLHVEKKTGAWAFSAPSGQDPSNLAPAWESLREAVLKGKGEHVEVSAIYQRLQASPFGVREGILPILLVAYLLAYSDGTALFERGRLVHHMSDAVIERLLRVPSDFSLQSIILTETQGAILDRIGPMLGVKPPFESPLRCVVSLLSAVEGLPEYTRQTPQLRSRTTAVRGRLLKAQDPSRLLFHELPIACDVPSFLGDGVVVLTNVDVFVERLREALRELGRAYDGLLRDAMRHLQEVFRLPEDPEQARDRLATRSQRLLGEDLEAPLKAFLVRASHSVGDHTAWLESVATLLVNTPPSKWTEANRRTFEIRASETASSLTRAEALTASHLRFSDDTSVARNRVSRRFWIGLGDSGVEFSEGTAVVEAEASQEVEQLASRLAAEAENADPEVVLAALATLLQQRLPAFSR